MIHEAFHSNLVILADGLKACVTGIYSNALMAKSEANEVMSGNRQTLVELARPISYKSSQRYAELNLIMYSAFFLESYINTYDYAVNSSDPNYQFEVFSKLPTSKKWENHFPNSQEFLSEIRNLFAFRNFLVHSKPIRHKDNKNEVFVKGSGWIPVSTVSTFISNDLGLTQENFPVEQLRKVCSLVGEAVDLIEAKSPGFNRHYKLKPNVEEQLIAIQQANEDYRKISKALQSNQKYMSALKKLKLPENT